jgi:hypothetical protein
VTFGARPLGSKIVQGGGARKHSRGTVAKAAWMRGLATPAASATASA